MRRLEPCLDAGPASFPTHPSRKNKGAASVHPTKVDLFVGTLGWGTRGTQGINKEYSDSYGRIGSNGHMTYFRRFFLVWIVLVCIGSAQLVAQRGPGRGDAGAAEQLFALGNQARAEAGVAPLAWDPALAAAAYKHCERMVAEGALSHRYNGELDLSERAALAGAHFGLIEENIAVGSYPKEIHEGWMHSPGHKKNLLNPEVDHAGIAVIVSHGSLYAVTDFETGVKVMNAAQVEASIAKLVHMSGLTIRTDPRDARAACTLDHGLPRTLNEREPGFIMRWQGADLEHLPPALVQRLGSREYHSADVGSCPPRGNQQAFTQYRIAVLLY